MKVKLGFKMIKMKTEIRTKMKLAYRICKEVEQKRLHIVERLRPAQVEQQHSNNVFCHCPLSIPLPTDRF